MTGGRPKGRARGRGRRRRFPEQSIRTILRSLPEYDFEAGPVSGTVRSVCTDRDDPGGELARLTVYDLDPELSARAQALLLAACQGSGVPGPLAAAVRTGARPELERALHDVKVPDSRKTLALPLYVLCGGEVAPDDMPRIFGDVEAVIGQLGRQLADEASPHPQGVEQLLASSGLMPELTGPDRIPIELVGFEAVYHLAGSLLCRTAPEAAAATVCAAAAIARERDTATAETLEALDLIAGTGCGRAAWGLAELAAWPAMGAVGERAAAGAGRLASAGVAPSCPVLVDWSHGFVSAVDGSGSRGLHLFFRTAEGTLDGLTIVVNDVLGLRDAWCAFGEGSNLQSQIEDDGEDISRAPCTLDLARRIIGDCFALHARMDRPPLGRLMIYRPYLGKGPIPTEPRTPNLGAYMTEVMEPTPALVEGSEELVDHPSLGNLNFASDQAYEFLRRNSPGRKRRPSGTVLDAFAREVAPLGRDLLLSRMAANLEVESIAGRAKQAENRLGARVWLAVSENVVPFHEVPYVRAMCGQTAEMVLANIRMGFRNQAEADQAGLDAQDGDGDLPF